MTYNPIEAEQRWQNFWDEEQIYKFDRNSDLPIYSIDTPPPTVSGAMHIGHIFSYTQAEVIARFKRMQGHNLFYPFGFDDNGLPTERLVEKELGIRGSEMPRQEFVEKCLELTAKYRKQFRALWQSLGISADWNLEYSSISSLAQRISQRSFLELLKQGNLQKKDSPALWCPECQTSVAQAEVDDKELPSQFHDIKFRLENGNDLMIATTRPELLPACVAVFVHPEDQRYQQLIGKKIITPLGDEVEILADDKVSKEKGTGIVMCCTYGDETDMYWVKKYNLPEKVILNRDGTINNADTEGSKMNIRQARRSMVARLGEQGDLANSRQITHSVGVHERCGTPMEILPVSQWFICILQIKQQLLNNADRINWHPPYMKKRYIQWVEGLKWDWCVSRQRFFGVPIPVWYSKKTGEVILPDANQLPVDPQKDLPQTLPDGHTHDDIEPDRDVLDTWATSSMTPGINSHWGEPDSMHDELHPMNLRPQAHDIIRTWALYTIVQSELHHGDIPWTDIMISGHVQAKKGEKISKSKGNAQLTPEELIQRYSADAVRYWACGATLGKDTMFDEKEIQNGKRLITKLWNATQLATMNLKDFNPQEEFDEANLEASDKWVLLRLQEVANRMYEHLGQYEVGLARTEFEKFFWSEFCDNYLEIIKDRLYHPENHENGGKKKKSAQYTLYRAFNVILKLIAPYLPFITEEIYQNHFRQFEQTKSVHLTRQPRGLIQNTDNAQVISDGMDLFKTVISGARKFKTDNGLRLGEEIEATIIRGTREQLGLILPFLDDIRSITRAQRAECIESDSYNVQFIKK